MKVPKRHFNLTSKRTSKIDAFLQGGKTSKKPCKRPDGLCNKTIIKTIVKPCPGEEHKECVEHYDDKEDARLELEKGIGTYTDCSYDIKNGTKNDIFFLKCVPPKNCIFRCIKIGFKLYVRT